MLESVWKFKEGKEVLDKEMGTFLGLRMEQRSADMIDQVADLRKRQLKLHEGMWDELKASDEKLKGEQYEQEAALAGVEEAYREVQMEWDRMNVKIEEDKHKMDEREKFDSNVAMAAMTLKRNSYRERWSSFGDRLRGVVSAARQKRDVWRGLGRMNLMQLMAEDLTWIADGEKETGLVYGEGAVGGDAGGGGGGQGGGGAGGGGTSGGQVGGTGGSGIVILKWT